MRKAIIACLLLTVAVPAMAADKKDNLKPAAFGIERFYFGAGVNQNSRSSNYDDAQGFQVFAGYDLGINLKTIGLNVEAGYWDSGEFEHDLNPVLDEKMRGPWAAAVLVYRPMNNLDLFARAGYSSGDDRGPMGGAGVGFWFTKNIGLRGELVVRDETDSIQANIVFQP